ncbi:diguanylate cyclase [Aestuariirhabdus sp. Z084]|uniref:sensor domain-containing diguanylate cyclase n=1 Tax=Aestuariirhabdus haliotis TaxID=2918751 RepID=UPI00201B400D|nr:sensor domain-containing diguanylate cyclase [Aestuariirhabdus haliotis]MCL6415956.1 diguanylate cyclase [Aestuariirhabdus haliotis]
MRNTLTPHKLHPLVQINFIPRVVATASCFFVVISLLQWQLLSLHYFWLVVLGTGWPFIARALSTYARNGRRQELINMHLDALFFGMVAYTIPNFFFIATLFSVICANAVFIGSYRLLIPMMITFICPPTIAFMIHPVELMEVGTAGKFFIALFMLAYFTLYGILGYIMVRRLIKLNKTIKELSSIDGLTQSYNRAYLDKTLQKEINRSQRSQQPLTIIFADIDHFKRINDEFGHIFGDDILKGFAALVQGCIRQDTDWVARFGGEEFVIVLPETTAKEALIIAERIRKKLHDRAFTFGNSSIKITCSFGITEKSHNNNIDLAHLFSTADKALYQAKSRGRDRAIINNEGLQNNTSAQPVSR